jgi:hypothetical protein
LRSVPCQPVARASTIPDPLASPQSLGPESGQCARACRTGTKWRRPSSSYSYWRGTWRPRSGSHYPAVVSSAGRNRAQKVHPGWESRRGGIATSSIERNDAAAVKPLGWATPSRGRTCILARPRGIGRTDRSGTGRDDEVLLSHEARHRTFRGRGSLPSRGPGQVQVRARSALTRVWS